MKSKGADLITEYLTVGGLFNPEMMEHDKVRNMVIELRKDVEEIEAIREYLWPNQTGLPNKHRDALTAIKARERLGREVLLGGMAGELERAQVDLANEKSISSLNAKAGLELEKQLAVAQQTIKELRDSNIEGIAAENKWREHAINFKKQLEQSESGSAGLRMALERCASIMQAGLIPEQGLDEETHTDTQKEYWASMDAAKTTLSTPAGKSMVAREVLEQAQEALHDLNEFADTLNGVTVSGDIGAKCIWDRVKKGLSANQELERSGL